MAGVMSRGTLSPQRWPHCSFFQQGWGTDWEEPVEEQPSGYGLGGGCGRSTGDGAIPDTREEGGGRR